MFSHSGNEEGERTVEERDFNEEKGEGLFLPWIGFPPLFPSSSMIFTENKKRDALLKSIEDIPFKQLQKEEQKLQPMPVKTTENHTDNAWGILLLPKIDLKAPILEGSTAENLGHAVGHIAESGMLGANNENFSIAGHRSHTFGRFFNRLDEVEVGDQLQIVTATHTYTYKVFQKKIVQPTNTSVLQPIQGKSVVTLITCHPLYSSKQRLIILAEKIREQKKG